MCEILPVNVEQAVGCNLNMLLRNRIEASERNLVELCTYVKSFKWAFMSRVFKFAASFAHHLFKMAIFMVSDLNHSSHSLSLKKNILPSLVS